MTPESTTGTRVLGRALRLVLVLGTGLGLGGLVLFAVAWATFAGGRFGWIWTMLAFGLLGSATGWLAVSKQWSVARRYTTLTLAVVLAVAGIVTAHFAPPTPGRLRDAIESVAQPGWRLVHEEESGNAMCFDYCTSIARQYGVDAGRDAVVSQVESVLTGRHCSPPGGGTDRVVWECRPSDDIELRVEVASGVGARTPVYIRASSSS